MKTIKKDGTLKKIFCYIKKYNLFLVLSLVFAAISVALTLYVPILIGHAIDCIVGPDNVDFDRIISLFLQIITAVVITSVCQWLKN